MPKILTNYLILFELKSNPDVRVIVITETEFEQDKNYGNINLDGYNFMRSDSKTNPGGEGIYIKDGIEYEIIKQIKLDLNGAENLSVKLEINNKSFIIRCVYRHLVQLVETLLQFSHFITEICHELNSESNKYYVLGDFKIDLIEFENNNQIRN